MSAVSKPKSKLFFVSRRPKWRGIPADWVEPDAETYAQLKMEEGFLTEASFQDKKLAEFPTLKKDIDDLDQLLIKAFFEANQMAKHFQNDHFRQQWILLVGTFLTSLIAALTVFFASQAPDVETEGILFTSINVIKLSGVLTATVTFVTTIVTSLAQSHQSQFHWYKFRTIAEELRRTYYLYLTHLPPYHVKEAVEILEDNIAAIIRQPTSKKTIDQSGALRKKHSIDANVALVDLYRRYRVTNQMDFYKSRIAEARTNDKFVKFWSVVFVAGTALIAAANAAIFGSSFLVAGVALLPIVAALLVMVEKIYDWGRQIKLYEDAVNQLTFDDTIPLVERSGNNWKARYASVLGDYVSAVEATLKSETDQWGQGILKDGSDAPRLSAQETLQWALAKSNLPEERIKEIQALFDKA